MVLYDEISTLDDEKFEEMYEAYCELLDGLDAQAENAAGVIYLGVRGLWSGVVNCGGVCDSFTEVVERMSCDYIRIETVDATLKITGNHHDGRNVFFVRLLTKDGLDAYLENEYDDASPIEDVIGNTFWAKDLIVPIEFQKLAS